MRYSKLALQYLKKNFLYVFALTFVPAVIIGTATEPTSLLIYFRDFLSSNSKTFVEIFNANSEMNLMSALLALIIVPIVMLFISALCGIESKHMRLGEFSMNRIMTRVNNNFLSVIKVGIVFVLIFQLFALFSTSFAVMWIAIFGIGRRALAFIIVTDVILMVALIYVMSSMLLWLPIMSITGLSMRKAFVENLEMIKGKTIKLFLSVAIPLILPFAVMSPLAYFDVPFRMIVNVAMYWIMLAYYITLMYVSYCDIADIDREDLKKYKYSYNEE